MAPERSAEEIASIVLTAFPGSDETRPAPEQIEACMRPLGVISSDTERWLRLILYKEKRSSLGMEIGHWVEANIVVSGEGADKEQRIQYLIMDTCTCVLTYLKAAIAHASGTVDQRVLNLLSHKFFQEK